MTIYDFSGVIISIITMIISFDRLIERVGNWSKQPIWWPFTLQQIFIVTLPNRNLMKKEIY